MKCSKCGFDNPEDAIFCKKCDWKLGETYIPEMKINPIMFALVALALGVIAVLPIVFNFTPYVSIGCGALGLVIGGYSFNVPRLMGAPNKGLVMVIAGAGLILSVISFIYGLYLLVA